MSCIVSAATCVISYRSLGCPEISELTEHVHKMFFMTVINLPVAGICINFLAVCAGTVPPSLHVCARHGSNC